MTSNTTTATISIVLTLNSFAADINLLTAKGSKLYLKAIEKLPKLDRIVVSLENRSTVRYTFKLYQSKFALECLLSHVPNTTGVLGDIIKHYQIFLIENILVLNIMYLEDSTNAILLASRIIPNLDPNVDPTN